MWHDIMYAEIDQNSINLVSFKWYPPDPRFANWNPFEPDKKIQYKDNFSKRFANLEVD